MITRSLPGVLLIATSLAVGGCKYQSGPYMMAAASRPAHHPIVLGEQVEVTRCHRVDRIFGIVMDRVYTSREMLASAQGDHDLLVTITWDTSLRTGLFINRYCTTLYATQADFVEPTPDVVGEVRAPPGATSESASATERTPGPAPGSSDTAETSGQSPRNAGTLDLRDDASGASRVLGWGGHTWRDPRWDGLARVESTSYGDLFAPTSATGEVLGLPYRKLRFGFAKGQLVEIRMELVGAVDDIPLQEAFGDPVVRDDGLEWRSDWIQVVLQGRMFHLRFTALAGAL